MGGLSKPEGLSATCQLPSPKNDRKGLPGGITMSEAELLQQLKSIFPNGRLPKNYPNLIAKQIPYAQLRGFARSLGLPTDKWLERRGFLCTNERCVDPHRDIESDMALRSGSQLSLSVEVNEQEEMHQILTTVLDSQPLWGNRNLTKAQSDCFYKAALDALQRGIQERHQLTEVEQDILVFETVQLLQAWNLPENNQEEEKDSFWTYICEQYGIKCNEGFGNSKAYHLFKRAIQSAMRRHNRFFYDCGKKYYTTLLTHAMAPKGSYFSLFELIFSFYSENLQYQFFPDDIAYLSFAKAMKQKFDGGCEEELHIRYAPLTSSIKVLYQNRPQYMRYFTEDIARRMDELFVGKCEKNDYLGQLLEEWFQLKSAMERNEGTQCRSHKETEYVATSQERIRIQYIYQEERELFLSVPAIRLGEDQNVFPKILIFQEKELIFEQKMKVYGNALCVTSQRMMINIDELSLDLTDTALHLVLEIWYADERIYSSGDKLYRDYLVFNYLGSEQSITKGTQERLCMLAMPKAVVEFDDWDDCATIPGNFQAYSIFLKSTNRIMINQAEVYSAMLQADGMQVQIQPPKRPHLKFIASNSMAECAVYFEKPVLKVRLDAEVQGKQYQVRIDNEVYGLAELEKSADGIFSLALPHDNSVHTMRIIDLSTQRAVFIERYVVINHFEYRFGRPFYCAGATAVELIVREQDEDIVRTMQPIQGENAVRLPLASGELRIKYPVAHCDWRGKNAFELAGTTFWHQDIDMSETLKIDCPIGYSATLEIGEKRYAAENGSFELGNFLQTLTHDGNPIVPIHLRLHSKDQEPVPIKLFSVAVQPVFISSPLSMNCGVPVWTPENYFIGKAPAQFTVTLTGKDGVTTCCLPFENTTPEQLPPLEDGRYDLEVSFEEDEFFAKKVHVPYHGEFFVGDPRKFRFEGLAIMVTSALLLTEENRLKSIALKQESGVIKDLRYCGETIVNGEELSHPCYQGTLYYWYGNQLRPLSDHDYQPDSKRATIWAQQNRDVAKEAVNPVHVWIINEHLIALRSPSGDGLYVNQHFESITDRVPQGEYKSSYMNPDYYGYEIGSADAPRYEGWK